MKKLNNIKPFYGAEVLYEWDHFATAGDPPGITIMTEDDYFEIVKTNGTFVKTEFNRLKKFHKWLGSVIEAVEDGNK